MPCELKVRREAVAREPVPAGAVRRTTGLEDHGRLERADRKTPPLGLLKRGNTPVIVLPLHRDMIALANNLETKLTHCPYYLSFGRILRESRHRLASHAGLGHERLHDWRLLVQERVRPKSLYVERNRGSHVVERLLIAVSSAHDHALQPQGVGDIAVFVLFDNNLELHVHQSTWALAEVSASSFQSARHVHSGGP